MAGLSDDERELFSEVIASRPAVAPLADQLFAGDTLSAVDADRLRSAIVDELAATGVTDGAINERGVQLDDLIDRVWQLSDLP